MTIPRLLIPSITAFKEPYLLYFRDVYIGTIEYEIQLMWLRSEIKKHQLEGYCIIKDEDVIGNELNYSRCYYINKDGLFINPPPGQTFHEKFLNELVGW